jgi:hypothetical protein
MPVSRSEAKNFVVGLLAADLGLPPSQFEESDDLEGDYLYDSAARVNLGKKINKQHWHGVRVTPMEMDAVSTIKSLVDLVFVKARGQAPVMRAPARSGRTSPPAAGSRSKRRSTTKPN